MDHDNLAIKLDDAALDSINGSGPSWQMVGGKMMYGEAVNSGGPAGFSSQSDFSSYRKGEDGTAFRWDAARGCEVPNGRWRR